MIRVHASLSRMVATRRGGAIIVALIAVAVYSNSLGNGFALDDGPIIETNAQVHGVSNLPEAVTGPYWPGTLMPSAYRPVTLAAYAVQWDLWNGSPTGFHLMNVVLHALATVGILLLLHSLGLGGVPAFAGAAVFAVHPVHVEAVSNIVGQAEIFSTIFYTAAILAYLRSGRGWGRATVVALLYFLSVASKEIGATLPAMLMLLEAYRSASLREAVGAALARWRTFLLLGVALGSYMLLRTLNLGSALGNPGAPWFVGTEPGAHVWTAIRVIPEYVRLMFWPVRLAADYGPATIIPEDSPLAPLVLLGLLMALLLVLIVAMTWSKARPVAVGILWFAIAVLPVSGLLFAAGVLLAERTLYLPSAGLALMVAGVFAAAATRRPRWTPPLAVLLVLALFAGALRTWIQTPVWKDTTSVLRHLAHVHPTNYRAQWALAEQFLARGQVETAHDHMALALRMVPAYFNIRVAFAARLADAGEFSRAEAQLDTARQMVPDVPSVHALYQSIIIAQGDLSRARTLSDSLIQRFPEGEQVWAQRARLLLRTGGYAEALTANARAIELARNGNRWRHMLVRAALHLGAGHSAEAARLFEAVRDAAPDEAAIPSFEDMEARLQRGEYPLEWL